MSERDLRRAGILLPEKLFGRMDLHSTVNTLELVLVGILGLGSSILMYFGGGTYWTWIGAGGFLIFLGLFYLVSAQAIQKQNRKLTLLYKSLEQETSPRDQSNGETSDDK